MILQMLDSPQRNRLSTPERDRGSKMTMGLVILVATYQSNDICICASISILPSMYRIWINMAHYRVHNVVFTIFQYIPVLHAARAHYNMENLGRSWESPRAKIQASKTEKAVDKVREESRIGKARTSLLLDRLRGNFGGSCHQIWVFPVFPVNCSIKS